MNHDTRDIMELLNIPAAKALKVQHSMEIDFSKCSRAEFERCAREVYNVLFPKRKLSGNMKEVPMNGSQSLAKQINEDFKVGQQYEYTTSLPWSGRKRRGTEVHRRIIEITAVFPIRIEFKDVKSLSVTDPKPGTRGRGAKLTGGGFTTDHHWIEKLFANGTLKRVVTPGMVAQAAAEADTVLAHCDDCGKQFETADKTATLCAAHKAVRQRRIDEAVARGKREITADIEEGRVPHTVKSFSALHDYVDANEYGGLCDDNSPFFLPHGDCDVDALNEIQETLDKWLKNGRK